MVHRKKSCCTVTPNMQVDSNELIDGSAADACGLHVFAKSMHVGLDRINSWGCIVISGSSRKYSERTTVNEARRFGFATQSSELWQQSTVLLTSLPFSLPVTDFVYRHLLHLLKVKSSSQETPTASALVIGLIIFTICLGAPTPRDPEAERNG
jgi:hypothetical protein